MDDTTYQQLIDAISGAVNRESPETEEFREGPDMARFTSLLDAMRALKLATDPSIRIVMGQACAPCTNIPAASLSNQD